MESGSLFIVPVILYYQLRVQSAYFSRTIFFVIRQVPASSL